MAWTDPRTWVTNEIVTSSLLNTHLRDNLKAIAHPYDFSGADVDVANTVTETSLWSKVITGNDMGANGALLLTLSGDYLKNNAAADNVRLRIKFGGSTLLDDTVTFNLNVTSANRQPWTLNLFVANRGATNSQFLRSVFQSHQAHEPVPAAGIGTLEPSSTMGHGVLANTAAVDTTAAQTLQVTAQWSAASANNSFRRRLAILELAQN